MSDIRDLLWLLMRHPILMPICVLAFAGLGASVGISLFAGVYGNELARHSTDELMRSLSK